MRHVTFAKPVTPYNVGDKRVVPDDIAERLQSEGLLSANEPFGAPKPAPQPQQPRRPILRPQRPADPRDARIAK